MGCRELVKPTPHAACFESGNIGCALQMPPRSAPAKVGNGVFSAADDGGYLCHIMLPGKMQFPYFADLVFGKRIVPERLASGHLPRVSSFIVDRGHHMATARHSIFNIFLLRAPTKMVRIAAGWIVAAMKGERSGMWGLSVDKDARKSRRGYFEAPGAAFYVKKAISKIMKAFPLPMPAISRAANIDLAPEMGYIFQGEFHSRNPFSLMKRDYHIEGVG